MDSVRDLLVALSEDYDLLAKFKADPQAVMIQRGIPKSTQDEILSGDPRRVRALLGDVASSSIPNVLVCILVISV